MRNLILLFSLIFSSISLFVNGQNSFTNKEIYLIDSLEDIYFRKSQVYRDSLKISITELKELKRTTKKAIDNTLKSLSGEDFTFFLNNFDSADFKLVNAVMDKNINLSIDYISKGGFSNLIDVRRICLYLLDFSNDFGLYKEIYYASDNKSWDVYKKCKYTRKSSEHIPLQYLTEDERNLAIWSLLRAYQAGDKNGIILSTFFEKGLYLFPKNEVLAKKFEISH